MPLNLTHENSLTREKNATLYDKQTEQQTCFLATLKKRRTT